MSIEWPSDLTYLVERSTFQDAPHDEHVRNTYDQGVPRVRRVYANCPAKLTFSILMPPEQVELFKGFYKNALANGQNWFTMPIWSGSAYQTMTVLFSSRYTLASYDTPDLMRVSLSLVVRNYFAS